MANEPDGEHWASMSEDRLLVSCEVRGVRGSGPGGQHRNKVETGIVIVHRPTGIRAEATERRSRIENRSTAIKRLRLSLAVGVRRRLEAGGYKPSALWTSRCRNRRLSISVAHADFPSLLAEALDVIEHYTFELPAAGQSLGVSSSQLVKLLKMEPAAFRRLNEQRRTLELPPLK